MQSSIIKIGNSNGLILPADILKSLNLGLKSIVSIHVNDGVIIIKPSVRNGWSQAALVCHEIGDDKLVEPDVLEDDKFTEEEWTC